MHASLVVKHHRIGLLQHDRVAEPCEAAGQVPHAYLSAEQATSTEAGFQDWVPWC